MNRITTDTKPAAILLLIFNRSDKTAQIFERVREARPRQLFVAADGPRAHVPGETRLCAEARNAILDHIDWDCEVHTLLRDENLGCKLAVSSAISWFFDNVEEGIILEDDCLPNPTFFQFCYELLEKHRNNRQVMMISGNNFLGEKHGDSNSYMFSKCVLIWGWATWRRAWKHYDISMSKWPEYKQSQCLSTFLTPRLVGFWENTFDFNFSGKGTTWDVQWVFACWKQGSDSILPSCNMVQNIGDIGVHMKPYDPCIHYPAGSMRFPLRHPTQAHSSAEKDRILMNRIYRSALATIWYIVLFLFRSAVSRDRSLWTALCQTASTLKIEVRNRYLS